MPVCNKCGGPIEFRHIDGQPTLIHLDGGCCEGVRPAKNVPHRGAYSSPEAYVNPNAKCPVCGKMVFYFQNRFGSRVFFDDLGWPWPKHPCTDNPLSQKGKIKRVKNRAKRTPKVRLGAFSIYKLIPIDDADGTVTLKFRKVGSPLIVSTFRTSAEALANRGFERGTVFCDAARPQRDGNGVHFGKKGNDRISSFPTHLKFAVQKPA